jgi:hypothetical protein
MNEKKTNSIAVFHVPDGITIDSTSERQISTEHGAFTLKVPNLTCDLITQIAERLKSNRKAYLNRLTTDEIIGKIDLAVHRWLDPGYPLRQTAEMLLPAITGYDPEIIRLQLKRYMRNFRRKELLRFVDEEFDSAAMLDGFRPRKSGGLSRAYGPDLIFHVFSGNVPGVQLWSLVMGLLVKSSNLGKSSMAEPLMPVLFARSLAEIDERLADCISILPWKGGTVELENPAIQAAEVITVYGSARTVDAIRSQVPQHKRLLHYGHKISFAMIGREALTPDRYVESIHLLAEDIAVYDQQSCLAPQAVFVEHGGAVSPRQFAQLLAAEMERFRKWKRSALSDEETMAIRSLRNRYEMESISKGKELLFASSGDTGWTVVAEEEAGFEGSPLNRTIRVYPVSDLGEVVPYILPYREYLQSCGLAAQSDRLLELANLLGSAGVNRICALGQMNRAPAGWHHDGRFNLLDLVRFTDLESSAEMYADGYDPDFE